MVLVVRVLAAQVGRLVVGLVVVLQELLAQPRRLALVLQPLAQGVVMPLAQGAVMPLVQLPPLGAPPLVAAPPPLAVAPLRSVQRGASGVPQHLARVGPTRLGVALQGVLEDQLLAQIQILLVRHQRLDRAIVLVRPTCLELPLQPLRLEQEEGLLVRLPIISILGVPPQAMCLGAPPLPLLGRDRWEPLVQPV